MTSNAENQIVYISTADLKPHPDNPRKDVGDVTELAESIHANGILQNLTVVPDDDGTYTVIIGHRRLVAAKLAGVETVPCAVVEMDYKKQLHTMLTENMQRTDLTIYEQAKGFQLMLDMGDSVDTIARESGFSASTVKRRVKLLELDEDKVKAATERGATLEDYAKLDQIKSVKRKNQLLKNIGTANFNNAVKEAAAEEKFELYMDGVREVLNSFATQIDEYGWVFGNKVPMTFTMRYGRYNRVTAVPPEDSNDRQYYYTDCGSDIYLYAKAAEEPVDKAAEAAEKAKQVAEYQHRLEIAQRLKKCSMSRMLKLGCRTTSLQSPSWCWR